MADFNPINTQEEFDAAVQDRIKSEVQKYSDYDTLKKKAADYDRAEGQVTQLQKKLNEANEKIAGHDKTVSDLTARATAAESAQLKAKIASEYKIPYELAGRLNGTTEEELRKDAENLAKFTAPAAAAPLASTEQPQEDKQRTELRNTLHNLNLGGD